MGLVSKLILFAVNLSISNISKIILFYTLGMSHRLQGQRGEGCNMCNRGQLRLADIVYIRAGIIGPGVNMRGGLQFDV